jgi:hypothetical protein
LIDVLLFMFYLDSTGSPLRCGAIANINIFVNCAFGIYHVVFMVTLLFMFCSCATALIKAIG